jgi:hypothetical protein
MDLVIVRSLRLVIQLSCRSGHQFHDQTTYPQGKRTLNDKKFTCFPCLFSIEIIQVLIQEHSDCKEHEFPGGKSVGKWGLIVEDEDDVWYQDDEEGNQGDEIGGDPGGNKLEEELCEGRPQVGIGDAWGTSLVLEFDQIFLV